MVTSGNQGASLQDRAVVNGAASVSAVPASVPSAGVRPREFTDEYRDLVCKIGKGVDCCRYLAVGAGGWSCVKRTPMRFTIDSRAAQMIAKGDNCEGCFDAKPPFVLLRDRFEHAAGTIIYRCAGHDYGCASDDETVTGAPHTSMTLDPSGDYPFFTVPNTDFAQAIEARSGETGTGSTEGESAVPTGCVQS